MKYPSSTKRLCFFNVLFMKAIIHVWKRLSIKMYTIIQLSTLSFLLLPYTPTRRRVKVTLRAKKTAQEFSLLCSQKGLGSRALRKSPSRYISCVVQLFSQSCTKSRLCSERIGPNSSPVLKTRETQTGGPKMPSREGCAFYPFFPISFDKYNWLLKKFTPPGDMTWRLQFPAGLWDGYIPTLKYNSASSWKRLI